MVTRTFLRSSAFSSLSELLDWAESHGSAAPAVYVGPEGSVRGSVEVDDNNNPCQADPGEKGQRE